MKRAVISLLLLTTTEAVAQSAPPFAGAPPAYLPVHVTSTEPDVQIEIATARGESVLTTCFNECRISLPPGEYRFKVAATESTVGGSRVINVNQPSTIELDPDTSAHRSVGLGLGIAGPIMMIAGVVLLVDAEVSERCEVGASCDDRGGERNLGLFSLLGGIAAIPIGWTMFGTSFKPEYTVTPLALGRGRRDVDVAQGGSLWGASLRVSF